MRFNFDECMTRTGPWGSTLMNVWGEMVLEAQLWWMYKAKWPLRVNFDECMGEMALEAQLWWMYEAKWPLRLNFDECMRRNCFPGWLRKNFFDPTLQGDSSKERFFLIQRKNFFDPKKDFFWSFELVGKKQCFWPWGSNKFFLEHPKDQTKSFLARKKKMIPPPKKDP